MFSRFGFMPFFAILMLGMFLSMNAAWAQLPSEVEETSFNLQLNSLTRESNKHRDRIGNST